jgi:transposase
MDIEKEGEEKKSDWPALRRQIVEGSKNGMSFHQLGKIFGKHPYYCSRVVKNFKYRMEFEQKPSPGRPEKLTPSQKIGISNSIRSNPMLSLTDIKKRVGLDIDVSTIYHYLKSQGYSYSLAKKKPKLTIEDKFIRVKWAETHQNYDFSNVVFADECSVWLCGTRCKCWLKKEDDSIFETEKFPEKVQVWGAISSKGKIGIHIFQGNMNAEGLIRIYKESLCTQAKKAHYPDQWVLAQDNDPKHKAHATQDFLSHKGIGVLPWPSRSPDLNPIENVWAWLKRGLSKLKAETISELTKNILKVWSEIPEKHILRVVGSMEKRLALIQERQGVALKY